MRFAKDDGLHFLPAGWVPASCQACVCDVQDMGCKRWAAGFDHPVGDPVRSGGLVRVEVFDHTGQLS